MPLEDSDSPLVGAIAELAAQAAKATYDRRLPALLEVQGQNYYVDGAGGLVPIGEPLPANPTILDFFTIGGLVEYVRANRDDLDVEELAFHVAGPQAILLLGAVEGPEASRAVYARATVLNLVGAEGLGFVCGRYMAPEAFVIGLQTLFAPTEDRTMLLSLAGRIRQAATQETDDDGTSQAVTVRKGINLSSVSRIPSPCV